MSKSLLIMPTNNGFCVTWETGEFFTLRGITKPKHNSFYTKSKKDAEKKAEEIKKAGYKNIKIMECIY